MKKLKCFAFILVGTLLPCIAHAGFVAYKLPNKNYSWSRLKIERFETTVEINGLLYETTIRLKAKLGLLYQYNKACREVENGSYEFNWTFRLYDQNIITDLQIWDNSSASFKPAVVVDLSEGELLYEQSSDQSPRALLREYQGRDSRGLDTQFYHLRISPVTDYESAEFIIKYVSPCQMYWDVRRFAISSVPFYASYDQRCDDNAVAEFRVRDHQNGLQPPIGISGFTNSWTQDGAYWYTSVGPTSSPAVFTYPMSFEAEKTSFDKLCDEIRLLDELGYNLIAAVQQGKIHNTTLRWTSKEGYPMLHRFAKGSSGPFGQDLQETWKSKDEVIREYESVFARYERFGDDTYWQGNRYANLFLRLLSGITQRHLPGWYDTHARHSSFSF